MGLYIDDLYFVEPAHRRLSIGARSSPIWRTKPCDEAATLGVERVTWNESAIAF
jgi:hypothetical protein